MNDRIPELPAGWVWTRVDEVGEVRLGRQRSPEHHDGRHMRPYLRVANVFEDRIDTSDVKEMNFTPEEYEQYALKPGDILLNEGQSHHLVGRPAIYRGEVPGACFQNTLVRYRVRNGLLPEFALAILRTYLHLGRFRKLARWTTNIAHLGADRFAKVEFPLPPLGEQQRITDEVASYLSRLDAAVANLERVQAKLKAYRASVLKAAVEGRLVPTEAEVARAERRAYEPADAVLRGVLQERRRQWERAELAKLKASGKKPKHDKWTAKYVEPMAPDMSGLPELPEGWCSATIAQVSECLDSMRVPINKRDRAVRHGVVPYYGANGQVGWINKALFNEPLVLVVEDETFTGRTKPFSYLITGPSWVNNHAHVLRPTAVVLPEFLNFALAHFPFTPLTTGTTGRRKLTQKAMNGVAFALPPLAEQKRIVTFLEEQISDVDATLRAVEVNMRRCGRLRQAVLKWAFEGKLVDQDPNDEPAERLLERIRAEREGPAPDKTTKKKAGRKPKKVPA